MKLTKLSLVAVMAMSAAFAGGDIAPVEPMVEAPKAADCDKDTTIAGKLLGYYITDDSTDDMFGDHGQLAGAVHLDVSHKLTDNVSLNFGAVGYLNAFTPADSTYGYFEGTKNGAFFNVANITANYFDTTFVLGRQILDTPMLGGFDWLLAQGSSEAYTAVNSSIENVTLVASYVREWRGNNTGDSFAELDGDNWTVGAAYSDAFDASVWYYNVDAADYTQIYADAGTEFSGIKLAAQFASTDYDAGDDSTAFGVKAETEVSGIGLMAAVSSVSDAAAGFVGRDSMYTSSWNYFAATAAEAGEDTLSWKVGASTEIAGAGLEASYAMYGDEGSELDVILGYDVTDSINVGAVYSLTDYDVNSDDSEEISQFELYATYSF